MGSTEIYKSTIMSGVVAYIISIEYGFSHAAIYSLILMLIGLINFAVLKGVRKWK